MILILKKPFSLKPEPSLYLKVSLLLKIEYMYEIILSFFTALSHPKIMTRLWCILETNLQIKYGVSLKLLLGQK